MRVGGSLLMLAGIIVVFCVENPIVGAAMAAYAIVALSMMVAFRTFAVPAWQKARQASADIFGFIEENLSGTEDIRANAAEQFVINRLQHFAGVRLRAERRAGLLNVGLVGTFMLTFSAGLALAIGLGYLLYSNGEITIGSAFMIVAYTEKMLFPLIGIAHELQELQRASAAITRIHELTSTRPLIEDTGTQSLSDGAHAVRFANVSFSYPDDNSPVLRDINFALAPGETLGILGRTGSGKTTLARLLFRLFDVSEGSVRLDDCDIRDLRLSQARKRVALVTQNVELFKGTVRENLTFFDPSVPDARILATITDSGLDEWFRTSGRTLDSELEGGGTGLSAGEAQLLAFTRAYLKDPGLVILDEASSRLDRHTEACMTRAVDRLLTGRTGIVIAHRLSTVQRVDKILILEDGRIAEWGDRRTLVQDPSSRLSQLLAAGIEEVLS
jgi:ATP-binding cassette subfamily B protein